MQAGKPSTAPCYASTAWPTSRRVCTTMPVMSLAAPSTCRMPKHCCSAALCRRPTTLDPRWTPCLPCAGAQSAGRRKLPAESRQPLGAPSSLEALGIPHTGIEIAVELLQPILQSARPLEREATAKRGSFITAYSDHRGPLKHKGRSTRRGGAPSHPGRLRTFDRGDRGGTVINTGCEP
ncbi:hypothetical protein Rleg2_4747 (plasmid) [Rhizobium leguminosarum bv. trifolii WSM2304]|uniref:Uncharacterized protein n=1 Tax=Rhizobium leguminosarum bv. trifolii (strain WSM2304) TaxID=395492 RepID=A0ABF7QUF8_RHILW|nr:hypothetical protein Rleg2_4747 [Rhizobium leguminosarum bv. trifolii WSM2304]